MGNQTSSLPQILYTQARHLHLGQCQCDCACALDLPPRSHLRSPMTPWVAEDRAVLLPPQNQWFAYFNPAGPVGIAVLNKAGREILAAFDEPARPEDVASSFAEMPPGLVHEAVDSLLCTGLVRPVETAARPSPSPTVLAAWLHVTEACNLNCAYCYVHKRPRAMTSELGRQAVDRLAEAARREGYATLKLKYAGGEPTLNFPVVQAIHHHAVCRTRASGLALDEVLLTNGVDVSDAVLDFLADGGLKLMVSLDGGPGSHGRTRARRNGTSTYEAVTDTVERAMRRGLRPDVSITLTALNLDGIPDAVEFALARGLPFSLNFYRECQVGPGALSPLAPDADRLVEAVRRVFDVVRAYPHYPVPLAGILDRTRLDVPHSHPCAAGRDYVTVDAEGRLSACQMLLDEPWSDLGCADPLAVIRRRGESVFQPVEAHEACRACLWRAACSGGCPLMRQTALHSRYCQVYQALLPELVLLEANRLVSTQAC